MELNVDDLAMVWGAVFDIQAKCYNLGVVLKVPVGKLDGIRNQYPNLSDQLREILKEWLKTSTQRTWQTLADALKSRIVDDPTLASDIEAEHCQGTPGQASRQVMPRDVQMEALQQHVMALQQHLESTLQPQQSVERLQQQLQEQQRAIEAGERKRRKLTQQLQSMKQTVERPQETDQLKQKLQKQQCVIEAGQRQQQEHLQLTKGRSAQPQPIASPPQQEITLRKLIWWDSPKAPRAMYRGSVATDGTTVYCSGHCSTSVHQYHSDTQQWSTLPNLPHHQSTLVMANSKLTSVGGYWRGATDSLLSLMGEGRRRKWSQHFPPMTTKRYGTAAICHSHSLIVAGGYDGRNRLATVEVLNMDTRLWSIASSLPHPLTHATTSICGERLYLLGGYDQTDDPTHSVLACSISELLHSCKTLSQSTIWQCVADAPYKASSCATLCGQLVAVGGADEANKTTTAVSAYDESINSWLSMEAMKTPRWSPIVANLHDNTLIVIGGHHRRDLDTVEVAKVY